MCSNHCRSHFTVCKVKVPSSSKIMTSLFPSPKYLSSYCKLSLLDQNHYNLVTVNCLYLTLRISSYAKMGTICHRGICLVPRAHYCAQPMLFRSRGLSKFFIVLVIRLGYITEMHWSRRCEKMLYRDEGRGICPLPHMSITQNVSLGITSCCIET